MKPFESSIPESRIRSLNNREARREGEFILYWMVANRRTSFNYSLQRAVDWAVHLQRPLVVLEALGLGYPWACDRFHQFVIDGMRDNQAALAGTPVYYYPYIEMKTGAGRGMIEWLANRAAIVISDDFPCFFLPNMHANVAKRVSIPLELVDSNGLYPMRATDSVFSRAFDFRRFLQRELLPHLADSPSKNPLARKKLSPFEGFPDEFTRRWPAAALDKPIDLSRLPLDHDVSAVTDLKGGVCAADRIFAEFVASKLERYDEDRNHPDRNAASGLSPYLHFGHISAHAIFETLASNYEWDPGKVAKTRSGKSRGWWGFPETVEGFLDELVTWRELGYNRCALTDDFDQYSSLPEWARKTLAEHAGDRREFVYTSQQLEASETHDKVWNAAQRQLVTTGRMQNYLRMLWGKKILEWSPAPEVALESMIHLNNKYAVDGRNPNSYSGIFWVLGRYDRAWGPVRPVYGTIRYMSSDNTVRKLDMKEYLKQYS